MIEIDCPAGLLPARLPGDRFRVTFQDLILKLSEFWAAHGCLIQQPSTWRSAPAPRTPRRSCACSVRSHWNVAYVQPSRRPDDGRFGENPNRLFKHHQFQVILKPAPDEVQQLYLESLEACGIDPRQHDVRFEEDNWESPTLGAWGIGWQVMLDGQEITQFTYFQQVGGIDLSPISAEITYGLERIAMFLQKVDSVYDLQWAPGVTYGEVRLSDEVEQSKYAFGQVDMPHDEFVALHRELFDRHFAFAQTLLRSGLVLPGLRAVPEVLAPVQRARLVRRCRRDRAHRVHPQGAPARGGRGAGVRGAPGGAGGGGGNVGGRT